MRTDILPWACNPESYPKLATAMQGGLEYVVWEMPDGYQAAQRTPLNGLRQRKWRQRAMLPTVEEAFYAAQCWAWEAKPE